MATTGGFGNGPDAVPDPNDQHAKNVQEMRMRLKAAHDLQQRQLAQRFRPFAHDPVEWEKRTTNKKNAVPEQGQRSALPPAQQFGFPANSRKAFEDNMARAHGGLNATAPYAGADLAPILQLSMALRQRQRNNPGSLGRMVPNLAPPAAVSQPAPAERPFDQHLMDSITANRSESLKRGRKVGNNSMGETAARALASQDRMLADAGLDASPENRAQNLDTLIRQNRMARQAELASRKSEVVKAAKALGDVRKFGISPEKAYALRGVNSAQGEGDKLAKIARFGLMGFSPEQAMMAADMEDAAKRKQTSEAIAALASGNLQPGTDAYDLAMRMAGGANSGVPGSTLTTGLSRRDRDNAINEAIKANPKDPMAAFKAILETEGITAPEAAMAVRMHHPVAVEKGFDPSVAETPWSGANPGWQAGVVGHYFPNFTNWLVSSPYTDWMIPDWTLPDGVRNRKRGIPNP